MSNTFNWDNESFNDKVRDERLPLELFLSREEAHVTIETWCWHYNQARPHSSLEDLTPIEFRSR